MLAKTPLTLGALAFAFLCLDAFGCNLLTGVDNVDVGQGGHGGTSGTGGTATTTSSGTTSTGTTSTTSTTTSTTSTTTSTTSTTTSTTTTTTTVTDPYEQNRQACIDEINTLRATKGLAAYQRWQSAESCVDQQATHDESVNIYHDAFAHGTPACGGSGQNECPGWGADAIVGCLDQMWDERLQAGCAGCDACDTYTIFQNACPNCSFYGPPVCGHYVNMSSATFTEAACGFSTDGSWAAINFE